MSVDDVRLVVRGWTNLSESEKAQVYEIIKSYHTENNSTRKTQLLYEINGNVQSVDVGPVGTGRCTYCGR